MASRELAENPRLGASPIKKTERDRRAQRRTVVREQALREQALRVEAVQNEARRAKMQAQYIPKYI